jgi:hypothetical protein
MTLITSALKTGPPRSKGYRLQTAAGGIDSATGCPEAVVLDRGISGCDRSNEQEAIKILAAEGGPSSRSPCGLPWPAVRGQKIGYPASRCSGNA